MRAVLLATGLALLPLHGLQCPKCVRKNVVVVETPPDTYEVEIRGVDDPHLLTELREASRLIAQIKKEPQSFPALQYRTRSDIDRLIKVMHAYGYYSAKINVRFEREGPLPKVILIVYPGASYPLISYELVAEGEGDFPLNMITLKQLGIELDKPVVAENILEAQRRIRELLIHCGYPLVKVYDEEVTVDQTAQTVAVIQKVDSGPLCRFGDIHIKGLKRVKRRFITQCMNWKRGQRYSPQKVECMVDNLRRSGLFQHITIMHDAEAAPGGNLPMQIDVKEAKQRTIAIGASYSVDQGIGPELEWEHRNLWGMGETIGLAMTSGYRRKEAKVYFARPHFLRCDQTLFLSVEGARDTLIAYDQDSISTNAYIERIVNRCFSYSWGLRYEWLDIDDTDNNGSFNLLGAPIKIEYKRVDNPVNPSKGFRVDYDLIPTVYIGGNPTKQRGKNLHVYTKQIARLYGYLPIDRCKRYILAGKFMIGSIVGASDILIPTSHRFLMGSVSTLRGYRFETVGPLNAKGTPIGGRSLLLYGIEGRAQTTENLGFVVYYEMGNVYAPSWPRFDGKLLKSVGTGLRYFTPLGPIGVDIAFPLNRRPIDHAFEIYVSIGQTF